MTSMTQTLAAGDTCRAYQRTPFGDIDRDNYTEGVVTVIFPSGRVALTVGREAVGGVVWRAHAGKLRFFDANELTAVGEAEGHEEDARALPPPSDLARTAAYGRGLVEPAVRLTLAGNRLLVRVDDGGRPDYWLEVSIPAAELARVLGGG